MLWCPSCQLEALPPKKFCRRCGGALQEKPLSVEPPAAASAECPSCHSVVAPEARFCKYCGRRLTPQVAGPPPAPPQPPAPVPVTQRISGATEFPGTPSGPSPVMHPRRPGGMRGPMIGVGVAAALIVVGGLAWYFLGSLRATSARQIWSEANTRLSAAAASIGTATVAQADTPMFAEPSQNSRVVGVLAAGQGADLLRLPDQPGAEGLSWVLVRSNQQTGFVEARRLTNLVGLTDAAQHQILWLQLHPENSESAALEQDIALLQDFVRRFPDSPLAGEIKLALADRSLTIARRAADQPKPDHQRALELSKAAANLYSDASQTAEAADRGRAQRGRQEALQLASLCDARLNPPAVAHLEADQQTIYRGQPVTLSWSAENAAKVTLEPGTGAVEPRGSRTFRPQQSTTYRLVAYGQRGHTEATVQVTVVAPPPTVTLSATPPRVQRGQPVTLTWSSENATELSLSPEGGRVGPFGSIQVYPSRSGAYQIIARGEGGETQAQAHVAVDEPPRVVVIPAGTQLAVRLVDPLNSRTSQPGQVFRATLDQPISVEGQQALPKHSEVRGRVVSASRSGRVSGVAQMSLVLFEVSVAGQTYTIYTDPLPLSAPSERGRDAAKIGAGAALGAIIGAIAGGGKGAATGAAAGAGAGTGVAVATRGKEIELRPETVLQFRVGQNVTVRMTR
jgi:hypothetical protein